MTDEGVRNRNTPSADSHPGGATSLQTSETRVFGPFSHFGRWWVDTVSPQATAPGYSGNEWTPLEVGPIPPALRPVLCWCKCAVCAAGHMHR